MGRGTKAKSRSQFRKELSRINNAVSNYSVSFPGAVKRLNSRLYDFLRSQLQGNWRKQGEYVVGEYESSCEKICIDCSYNPKKVIDRSRAFYHKTDRTLLFHVRGLTKKPDEAKMREIFKSPLHLTVSQGELLERYSVFIHTRPSSGSSEEEVAKRDGDSLVQLVRYLGDSK